MSLVLLPTLSSIAAVPEGSPAKSASLATTSTSTSLITAKSDEWSETSQIIESSTEFEHESVGFDSNREASDAPTESATKISLSKLTMGLLTAAKKSIEEGDFAVAEEAYRQTLLQADILQSTKRVQKINLQLARLLKRMNQFEEAMGIYARLDLKTNKPEVHLEYIRLLHESGATEKALNNCEILLKNHPDFLKAELTAGMITKSKGDLTRALLHFDQYLAMHPKDPLALLETGNLLEKMKQWKQAKILYDKLLEIQPENRQALRNRGNTLVHLEKYELAVKDLTASGMQAIPWVERILRYAKGQIDIANAKNKKEGLKTDTKEVKFSNNQKIQVSQIEEKQESPVNIDIDSTVTPKNKMIAKLKEIDFIEFSPKEKQIEQSMIAIKEPSEDSSKKADFVKDSSNEEASVESISSVTETDINTSFVKLSKAAKQKHQLDELSESSSQINTVSKVNPFTTLTAEKTHKKAARVQDAILPTKGMELVDTRNYQRALPILRLEVKRYPQNKEISNSLRVALQSMSLFDDILRELDRILTHHPNDYDIQLKRSFYLLESGDIEAALETTLPETDPYALYIRATAMKKLGRFKDAQVLQKRLENLDQRFTDHQTGRFLWLVKLKDYLFAYPLGKKLIQANRPWLSFPMAIVSRALDYPVEAVLYLTQTVQDDPKNAKAYFELSQIMDQLERPEDRDIFLQKALSIEPSNDTYKSYHQQLALKNP